MKKKKGPAAWEKKEYVLKTRRDREILEKIHEAEKLELSRSERFLVSFIRTQLKRDWRTPIIELLDGVIGKRRKKKK
jgi:hypothetical protein